MAHTKAGGTAKNLTTSNPQYLGVKLYDGELANTGSIIVRQRGTKFMAGRNVRVGKNHDIFAIKAGKVTFKNKRKTRYDGKIVSRKQVNVL